MGIIHSYLTFNGNCREAMIFYQQCLGGELFFQTVGESPLSEKMPKKMKDLILHAALTNGKLLLMGSDMVPETGLIRGNAVSLVLNSGSEKKIKSWYDKLSEGGQVTNPLAQNFEGALFAGLTDKFGNHWLLNYNKNKSKSIIMNNETQIRALIENWAAAVRNRDMDGILAHHSEDMVMYDVPPPFQSIGIDAYRKTWDIFFKYTKPGAFNIEELSIIAGEDVAFGYASMRCSDSADTGEYVGLAFRLTIGLKKIDNQWVIVHEHHSIPAE